MAALSMVDSFVPWVDRGQAPRGLEQELAACVECGYCENHCPTRGPWVSSTPRGRVRVAREACRASNETPPFSKEQTEAIFSCTLCGRCRVDCSVAIDSPTMWVEARSRLVQKGREVDNLKALAHVVEEHGNIAGKPRQQRHRWAERLPFFGDIAGKKSADLVYFVGCVTSFYPMVQDVARSFVQCLASTGVDFMLLGGEETCCGYPLISAGRLDKAVAHMKANIEAVRETGAPSLAVTCPGCYRMWKHEYERLTGEGTGIEVSHSSEFLWRLIGERRIQLGEAKGRFTYHDPCDLGRVGGIYDAPRSVIKAAPDVDFVELEENREYAVCCGSGGDFLTSNQEASLAVARRRLDHARSVGAETVVTACPSCIRGMTMARMAAKMPISVQDITQFVWKAIKKQDG
jgi:heterodisulfide reductase subunit D